MAEMHFDDRSGPRRQRPERLGIAAIGIISMQRQSLFMSCDLLGLVGTIEIGQRHLAQALKHLLVVRQHLRRRRLKADLLRDAHHLADGRGGRPGAGGGAAQGRRERQ